MSERKNIFQSIIDFAIKKNSSKITDTSINTGYPLEKKHICFKYGHNFYNIYRTSNQFSTWGTHKCTRCGLEQSFQYDF